MSTSELDPRPAFQQVTEAAEFEHQPISKLAGLALGVGILGLVAPVSMALLPLPILASLLGLISYVLIARDPALSGRRLAQTGLALGVLSAGCTLTVQLAMRNYLYGVAAKHATTYIETLAAGRKFEAAELMMSEPERQITGTNLEEYYANQTDQLAADVMEFVESKECTSIMGLGTAADWQFVEGVDILRRGTSVTVTVALQNMAEEVGSGEPNRVHVKLQRLADVLVDPELNTALWHVVQLSIVSYS